MEGFSWSEECDKAFKECRDIFLYTVRWAGLPSAVIGLSMLGKGVETSPAATHPRLVCA